MTNLRIVTFVIDVTFVTYGTHLNDDFFVTFVTNVTSVIFVTNVTTVTFVTKIIM